jgi:hypothetical protein
MSLESNMHAGGESDGCVPSKCPNNGGKLPAEGMEGRQPTKENTGQATAPRTQSGISELSDLHGVRKAARKDKRTRMTWERFWPLVDRWIPSAQIRHPHPNVRFDAKYLR